jgi:ribosomal protein L12E/L44/L45/RPP1/RPP2
MKREEIKAIFPDITDEQLDKVMSMHGAEIEKTKAKVTALETELKEKKEAFDNLNTEFETLKTSNASGEEWQKKYEALKADIDAKEKQAEADRLVKEKQDGILKRFDAVMNGKEFNHDAIKAEYLKKFGEAIELDDNKAKSDADIFHELTKDDASAFKGVTAVRLAGGTNRNIGGTVYNSKADIMKIKDATARQKAIEENPTLFS